jgi:hypothetical protein
MVFIRRAQYIAQEANLPGASSAWRRLSYTACRRLAAAARIVSPRDWGTVPFGPEPSSGGHDYRPEHQKISVRMSVSSAHHSELRVLVQNGTSFRDQLGRQVGVEA